MAKDNLTTEEILAKCRATDASGSDTESASAAPTGVSEAAEPAAAADPLAAARAAGSAKNEAAPSDPLAAARAAASSKKDAAASDPLAAARAAGGAGGAKPAGKSGGASAKASAKKTPSLPEGETPSVSAMLQAVREGKKPGAPAKPRPPAESASSPAAPRPMPTRPAPRKPGTASGQQPRRAVLLAILVAPFATALNFAWTMLVTVAGVSVLATARLMFPNVLVEPPMKFKVGPPSAFPFGSVDTSFKAARGIWIVHTSYKGQNIIYALASVCTHLGCTPSWLGAEQKFKCPCHGSGFYISGVHFEGPAPRPLERVGIRVAEDGMLEVDKSVKFQQELGQWEDSASYVAVS